MAEYEPTAHVRALMQEMTALEARIESLRLQAKVGMWASMASPPVALAGLWTDEWWPTIVVVFLAVFSVGLTSCARRLMYSTIVRANQVATQLMQVVPPWNAPVQHHRWPRGHRK